MSETRAAMDEALIRRRAFELWKARGCPEGSPEDDWFTAMRSVTAERDNFCPDDESLERNSSPYDATSSLPLGLRIVSAP